MQGNVLKGLRAERRPWARLALAVFILPFWLSLVAAVSPSAAADTITICTANGLKQIDPNGEAGEEIGYQSCSLCRTGACTAAFKLATQERPAPGGPAGNPGVPVKAEEIDSLPRGHPSFAHRGRGPPVL